MPTPGAAVTVDEAAQILGKSRSTVRRYLLAGQLDGLDRDQVEAHAATDWVPPRRDRWDPNSYWVGTVEAAAILEISRPRVAQLVDAERLPHLKSGRGYRMFRRAQLDVIANARTSRRLQHP